MNDRFAIKKSNIHGSGAFSNKRFIKGDVIGKLAFFKNPYQLIITDNLGKWMNHSWVPNCIMYKSKSHNAYYLVALHQIEPNTELTLNYNACPIFIERAPSWYT